MIHHAPVFRLEPTYRSKGIDLLDYKTYSNSLEPLITFHSLWTDAEWGKCIGFGGNPAHLLGEQQCHVHPNQYFNIFNFEISSWTGKLLESLPAPNRKVLPHCEVPHDTYLNTKHTLPENFPEINLFNFLSYRDATSRGRLTLDQLIRIFKQVH